MKLLILSRYDRQGASSRLRSLQYLPYLRAAGFDVEVAPFFDAAYLRDFYAGKRSGRRVAGHYLRRLRRLLGRRPDLIWLEKEALPWVPWGIEGRLLPRGVPLVSDYDDAVFHRYDLHRHGTVRRLLGRKIDRVMARSDLVLAGNDYLAARARAAGAPRVELVPTVIDTAAYACAADAAPDRKPRVGWIGTPETWTRFVAAYLPLLREVACESGAVFRAVGAVAPPSGPPDFEFLEWSEDREVALLQGMDLGIMPLPDDPWSRGKCGYKLIQYMACGLPVVASPVGVNTRIVEHGVNGFLADSEEEWRTALAKLLADPELRHRMGAAGRRKVEAEYSLEAYGPKVAESLRRVAERGQAR